MIWWTYIYSKALLKKSNEEVIFFFISPWDYLINYCGCCQIASCFQFFIDISSVSYTFRKFPIKSMGNVSRDKTRVLCFRPGYALQVQKLPTPRSVLRLHGIKETFRSGYVLIYEVSRDCQTKNLLFPDSETPRSITMARMPPCIEEMCGSGLIRTEAMLGSHSQASFIVWGWAGGVFL